MSAPPPPAAPTATIQPAEKRGDIHFAAKDAGLRKDVHDLGVIVGQLLEEQGGARLFGRVEEARRAAIDAREGDPAGVQRLEALVAALSPADSQDLIRAFSTYFLAVNLAETVHRIRRRRDYLREGKHRQPGGLEDTLFDLKDAGVSLDEVRNALAILHVEPVLTAHPTEPTRRTILRRQKDIVRRLIDMQNESLSPRELSADLENIRDDITAIWQTEEHPTEARTVAAEHEHVLFFLTDCIYRVLPVLYETAETAMEAVWGEASRSVELPVMVRMASWIGGDMVGRPEITARTIRDALARQRFLVLDLYHRECRELAEKLSQSNSRVGVSTALEERIRLYSGHFPNALGITPLRHRGMRYRVFMRLMMARLESTHSAGLYPFDSAEEFAGDLRLIVESLEANRGQHAGLFAVRRLLRRVETFGFHFMALDVRQEAGVNRRVIGRGLNEPAWLEQSPAYRLERLRRALATNESPAGELDNETRRAIGIFEAIAFCRRRYGKRSIGPYIISMAEGVDDVLSVLLLAQWGELRKRSGTVPLDIAPAFETIHGLEGAATLMRQLYAEPVYREHLTARRQKQTAMPGIADVNVDSDLTSARWVLLKAQRELLDSARADGVQLTLFHGRGGAIGAGGGKAHVDIRCAPAGGVEGGVRVIEQGELVANKYGVRAIALRTFDQALAAGVRSLVRPGRPPAAEGHPEWEDAMQAMAAASRAHYQGLVLESPGFAEYYRLATPADVIERMRLGTGMEAGLSGGLLAAAGTAPWVFAWTQSRNILPVWYGFGTGLASALARFGEPTLQTMHDGWYFFRTMVADVETALAKSDLAIAARYSALGGELHERFFQRIRDEFERTTAAVLRVKQQSVLLERDNTLRRSIRLRNPYVDPMSVLQVELLRRWRETGNEDLFNALVASVNGIARGLQDSG
ncbi:MAG: phosphoenolpyruvate carboxylase [Gammaproteobacteria bacterium]